MEFARFHIASGPSSLFERVRQVFDSPRPLQLHGDHLRDRASREAAPLNLLNPFDPDAWELMTVEARTDTGKFVSTAWRRRVGSETWWVVIGFQDTVRTLYRASSGKRGAGNTIIRQGPVWDLVDRNNRDLLSKG